MSASALTVLQVDDGLLVVGEHAHTPMGPALIVGITRGLPGEEPTVWVHTGESRIPPALEETARVGGLQVAYALPPAAVQPMEDTP